MMRRSIFLFYTTHSTRAVPFEISVDDAVEGVKDKYDSRWFGADSQYMSFNKTTGEYLPFFLCRGRMSGIYSAAVSYSQNTTDSQGNSRATTKTIQTRPQRYDSAFQENKSQIYGGYKFSNRRVSKVLRVDSNCLNMKKIACVDLSSFNINEFEMSTTTLRAVLKDEVIVQAQEEAQAHVRGFHPGASTININFSEFTVDLSDVYPVFLPCYISDVVYDGNSYTMYTSGRHASLTTGPYLLSGVALGRTATVATVCLSMLLAPIKAYGFMVGSLAAVPAYYAAYYAARFIPVYIRDRNRSSRAQRQADYVEDDAHGYRPGTFSGRKVSDEKHSSEQRRQRHQEASAHAASSGATGSAAPRDSKGYYRLLGLRGTEGIDDLRQAYRKKALKSHPDTGGNAEDMKALNEAYRVLRNSTTRQEYDRM